MHTSAARFLVCHKTKWKDGGLSSLCKGLLLLKLKAQYSASWWGHFFLNWWHFEEQAHIQIERAITSPSVSPALWGSWCRRTDVKGGAAFCCDWACYPCRKRFHCKSLLLLWCFCNPVRGSKYNLRLGWLPLLQGQLEVIKEASQTSKSRIIIWLILPKRLKGNLFCLISLTILF